MQWNLKMDWNNTYCGEGRQIQQIHYEDVYNSALILLRFTKEDYSNFQPKLELMQLPGEFLEQKCGKVTCVRGNLHPDVLKSHPITVKG
jgi:hypothetical protein